MIALDRALTMQIHTAMKTKNAVANYIADRKICKHMNASAANAIWRDLKADGWEVDLGTPTTPMLTKHDEQGPQRFFTFVKKSESERKVSYIELEVTL